MFNASKINARFAKAFILEGLNIILNFSYFYINTNVFHQIKGKAMGTIFAVARSNLTVAILKLKYLLCYHSDSNLITTHCTFSVVIWSTFAIHYCFCFLFFYINNKMVFLPINSLKFFVCLKNIGWFLNILDRSLLTFFHCFWDVFSYYVVWYFVSDMWVIFYFDESL